MFLTTTSDGMLRLPTTLDQLAPEMLEATLEMEDRRFFTVGGEGRRERRRRILNRRAAGVLPITRVSVFDCRGRR